MLGMRDKRLAAGIGVLKAGNLSSIKGGISNREGQRTRRIGK